MSLSNSQLLATVPGKQYADAGISSSALAQIWGLSSRVIEDAAISIKSTNVNELGLFTFVKEDLLVGQTKKTTIRPVFVLNSAFEKSAAMLAKKVPTLQNGIPKVELNISKIASESGTTRDEVGTSIKAIIRTAREAVKSGSRVTLDFTFGRLSLGRDGYNFKFNQDFIDRIQQAEKAKSQKLPNLSATSPSTPKARSAPSSPKPMSPNTKKHDSPSDRSPSALGSRKAPTATVTISQSINKNRPTQVGNGPRSARVESNPDNKNASQDDEAHRALAQDLLTTTKAKSSAFLDMNSDPDLCENCRTIDLRNMARNTDKMIDGHLAKLTLDQMDHDKKDRQRKAEDEKKKRQEIDDFNRSHKKSSTDDNDFYGYAMYNRNEEAANNRDRNRKHQEDLLKQIDDKKLTESQKKKIETQKELDFLKSEAEAAKLKAKREAEERQRKDKEHQNFLVEQMGSRSAYIPAQLGGKDTQFMSRLLSTAERKKRQLEEARERKKEQMDSINEKRDRLAAEREFEDEQMRAQRKYIEDTLKRERKDEMDKKRKQQQDARDALQQQMRDKKNQPNDRHIADYTDYPFGSEGERIQAIREHAKKCKRCGRLYQDFGTIGLVNNMRRASTKF